MRARSRLVLIACCVLACCGRRRPDSELESLLAAFDAAWRPERPGFEERVGVRVDAMIPKYAEDSRVMWRQARYLVALGLAEPDPVAARDLFARARSKASRCLEQDLGFRRRRHAAGWDRALATVDADRQACVDQLAWSWTRWWVASDPKAMGLDETPLDALTRRAQGEDGVWARAILAGCRRDRDPGADETFADLVAAEPWDLARVADWLTCGRPADDQREALSRLLKGVEPSDRGRSRAARARLTEL